MGILENAKAPNEPDKRQVQDQFFVVSRFTHICYGNVYKRGIENKVGGISDTEQGHEVNACCKQKFTSPAFWNKKPIK